MKTASASKESYFVKDPQFFKSLFRIMIVVAFQNLINYGVNMADNLMLGSYGQAQLSGAACVNQIFFMVNAFCWNFGIAFSVLAAQYWGKKDIRSINKLGGIELTIEFSFSMIFTIIAACMPARLLSIFTSSAEVSVQGVAYLNIIKFTFIPYAISFMLMTLLRNVETVNIAFIISCISLVINVCLNYLLIFGNWGFPEMGIAGAAIATLIARIVELLVLLFYIWKIDKKLHFFQSDFLKFDKTLVKSYFKVAIVVAPAGIAWAIATPIQGALLGKLSTDSIAANSVTSTYYQLLKVFAQAMSTAAGVIIGKTIGEKNYTKTRQGARTIEVLGLGIGVILGGLLFILRKPIISMYDLTPEATRLTNNMLIIKCFIILSMAYEHPVLVGTIRAGGDTRFPALTNIIVMWGISIPLAFMAVYWWRLGPEWIVIFIQSEQFIKCIPAFIRVRQYNKWIRNLTEPDTVA
jgi:putative MATE family efflux protein